METCKECGQPKPDYVYVPTTWISDPDYKVQPVRWLNPNEYRVTFTGDPKTPFYRIGDPMPPNYQTWSNWA